MFSKETPLKFKASLKDDVNSEKLDTFLDFAPIPEATKWLPQLVSTEEDGPPPEGREP